MNRKRIGIVAILVVSCLATYSVWWWRLGHIVQDGMQRVIADASQAGWTIATGATSITGFPFALRLSVPQPEVAASKGDLWQGAPVTVIFSPFSPRHPHVIASGRYVFTLAGEAPRIVTIGIGESDLSFDRAGLSQLSVQLSGINGKISDGPEPEDVKGKALSLVLERLAMEPVPHQVASWHLAANVYDLLLPVDVYPGLGRHIASAKVEARLLGSLGKPPLKEALMAWRDDGGTVEIDGLSLEWPPLSLSGKATLALDGAMQPMLASNAAVRGLSPFLEALGQQGILQPQVLLMLKMALGLVIKPGANGEMELNVPLSIQERKLYLGPVTLFKFPELVW